MERRANFLVFKGLGLASIGTLIEPTGESGGLGTSSNYPLTVNPLNNPVMYHWAPFADISEQGREKGGGGI